MTRGIIHQFVTSDEEIPFRDRLGWIIVGAVCIVYLLGGIAVWSLRAGIAIE